MQRATSTQEMRTAAQLAAIDQHSPEVARADARKALYREWLQTDRLTDFLTWSHGRAPGELTLWSVVHDRVLREREASS